MVGGRLKVLDLFSGIGGFSLGLERAGMKTVAFCEIEEYPRKVLKKHWPKVPIYEDIRELTSEQLKQDGITADLICGGYPCQPFSTAGKRQGEEDDRHLWPEMYRLIKTIRPRWVIAENVAGHISMGLDDVLSNLEAEDYAWWTFVIPACGVGHRHKRNRVWIVAYANSENEPGLTARTEKGIGVASDASGIGQQRGAKRGINQGKDETSKGRKTGGAFTKNDATNTICDKCGTPSRQTGRVGWEESLSWNGDWEITSEPFVCRGTHGISNRMDRLKGLGNAVVPQIPEIIGRAIMEIEND